MITFHEVQFPPRVSFGASCTLERRTHVVSLASGFEERNGLWLNSRRHYQAGSGVRTLNDLYDVINFFEARQGRLYGFRWKDWSDYKSCPPTSAPTATDQLIGTGDGVATVFQLKKSYLSSGYGVTRILHKPVEGSIKMAINGVELPLTDFTTNLTTGQVTFDTPPPNTAIITAGFLFDVPVRFDTDTLELNLTAFDVGQFPSIPLVEIRL